MNLKLNEKVSVLSLFDKETNKTYPYALKWHNKKYQITQVGLHHTIHIGKVLHHVYSVTDGNTFFRLNLNTENLHWTLEEVYDGTSN